METVHDDVMVLEEDIRCLASAVCKRRLETPAVFFLELYRPLSNVLYNISLVSFPVLTPLFGVQNMQRLTRILEKGEHVEMLLKKIEHEARG